jgi:putative transposase
MKAGASKLESRMLGNWPVRFGGGRMEKYCHSNSPASYPTLAKSVADAAMSLVRRQLEYKGRWYGTHVVVIDHFYPSTQLCHVCGYKNEALTLADRTWTCPVCGSVHDRDINAALNIRDEGLRLLAVAGTPLAGRESLNACGGAVRPPTVARPSEAGIPRC